VTQTNSTDSIGKPLKLLACPFCGRQPDSKELIFTGCAVFQWEVKCLCGCATAHSWKSQLEAETKWNTRHTDENPQPQLSSSDLLAAERERVWAAVVKLCAEYQDRNAKACIVQSAIAEFGPVPNSMGDLVRRCVSQ
jgi:hypothetical protein